MSVPVVYDTMVFLQAAARPDRLHATFRAVRDGEVALCLSNELLVEVADVLNRPAVRAKFPALTPDAVAAFVSQILASGTLFDPVPHVFTWPEHPDDDHVLNLAIHARAQYLVTWESRLLALAGGTSPTAASLRALIPRLTLITPAQLADLLKTPGLQFP